MALKTIPKPSETSMATMPHNEERRAQAVVKTGLIDAPNSDLFQIYCDLAGILRVLNRQSLVFLTVIHNVRWQAQALTIITKWEHLPIGQNGMCVHVLLDTEPLIVEDFYKDPDWAEHPYIKSGDAPHSYAGFPVVNKDNYVPGTLCLFNTDPKKMSESQEDLIKRVARNIAHLLDLQVEQRESYSRKNN